MPLSTFRSELEASEVQKSQGDLCFQTKQAQLKKKKNLSYSQFPGGFRTILPIQI